MDTNVRPETMERITTKELAAAFIEEQVKLVREQVGDKKVLLALSGGVDSSVVAALLIKAIGKQLVCVHVNHGLMRKNESEGVIEMFQNELDANLIYVDATDHFLNLLAGVADPERKRKIIGKEFITVFAEEARKLEDITFLAQGTIYPDILESIKAAEGKKAVKSHHNVGGLPEDLQFELVEPLKLLFKDEVRVVGEALGLPHEMVYRQPFPGPGLGVRCLGAITRDRLHALREADAILREEFAKNGLNEKVWQYFIAVPDIKSVGVKDESRYEGWPAIIRAVNTKDAMTATIEEIPYAILHHITHRITHEVEGINRVLLDLNRIFNQLPSIDTIEGLQMLPSFSLDGDENISELVNNGFPSFEFYQISIMILYRKHDFPEEYMYFVGNKKVTLKEKYDYRDMFWAKESME